MVTFLVLLGMLGIVSAMMTTKESRAEARAKFARWNPLWWTILIIEWMVILWPWSTPHR